MPEYSLIDSGGGEKLEQFGPYRTVRPAPGAVWLPHLPAEEWAKAHAHYERSSKGGGAWKRGSRLPDTWTIDMDGLAFQLKGTGFGHLGIFPEQHANWTWLTATAAKAARPISVLNLFAYTGGSTLAAAKGGAKVTHLDASRGIVTWANENAKLTGLAPTATRWIVDDVLKFVKRELKRGTRYDGIVLDPPSFGRGKNGEVWKIEEDLPELLDILRQLLSDDPALFLLTSHSPGFTAETFRNLLGDILPRGKGSLEAFELGIPASSDGRVLPAGSCARWAA